eukprot:scaffold26413_cov33-Phaeocystis_antarctica.AAC.1
MVAGAPRPAAHAARRRRAPWRRRGDGGACACRRARAPEGAAGYLLLLRGHLSRLAALRTRMERHRAVAPPARHGLTARARRASLLQPRRAAAGASPQPYPYT